MINVIAYFEKEKKTVFDKLKVLNDSIVNLQYEGKVSFQKNVRNIGEAVECLENIFLKHKQLDDEVIFPFSKIHIPRLDVMINFLNAERNELKSNLETFEFLFQKMMDKKSDLEHSKISEQLKEKGTYVVCIMRNHIQTESEGVYRVLDKELNLLEKKKLYSQIKKHIKHNEEELVDIGLGKKRM